MERKLKKELSEYFEPPKPQRKRAFVRQFELQKINLFYMVSTQTRYISKWVWCFSGLFFGAACLAALIAEWKYVSMVFSFAPFMVMISVTESTRSYRYGMEELELSARFALKSIVMARMIMLGVGNLVVLAGITLLLRSEYSIPIVYVMAPYFLTAGGGLCVVRKIRGRESTLLCFGLSTLVCVLELYLPWRFEGVFAPECIWVWACVCVIGMTVTVREGYRMIRMTEDLAWS